MKNPIPDATTARRWNLLSDASSSAAIKSSDRISATALPTAPAACLAPRGGPRSLVLRRNITGPGNAPPT